jgi:hypothetical protein
VAHFEMVDPSPKGIPFPKGSHRDGRLRPRVARTALRETDCGVEKSKLSQYPEVPILDKILIFFYLIIIMRLVVH